MAYTVPKANVIDYPPSDLSRFHLYGYEWIDNMHFVLPPSHFVEDASAYVAVVKERFREAGWEGDGNVGLLWLAPFVFPLSLNVAPRGVVVWHVKQVEDGISFLLSPIELPFEEFRGIG